MSAEPSVQRRVVALTGAGGSLGLLITQALLRRGDIVIANHRSPSPGLRSLAVSFPNSLHPLLGDVGAETPPGRS